MGVPIILNNNPVAFSKYVEQQAIIDQTNLMDIICGFCSEYDLEHTEIIPYLTENLKKKIRKEAEQLRYYKSTTTTL
jgi:hypothetical protein